MKNNRTKLALKGRPRQRIRQLLRSFPPIATPQTNASAFYSKPTLRNLEKKFTRNEEKRKPFKQNLISRIDRTHNRYESLTKNTLVAELQKSGINLVFRQNEQGFIYGATFIDHINKAVFNGSDLGKAYSAKALTEKFANVDKPKTYLKSTHAQQTYLPSSAIG